METALTKISAFLVDREPVTKPPAKKKKKGKPVRTPVRTRAVARASSDTSGGKVFVGSGKEGSGGEDESPDDSSSGSGKASEDELDDSMRPRESGERVQLEYDDEFQLFELLCADVQAFLVLPSADRRRLFRRAMSEFAPKAATIQCLADFEWAHLPLTLFLPATMRGKSERDSDYGTLAVDEDGRLAMKVQKSLTTKVEAMELRTPEWTRGILCFYDMLTRVVSPRFAVWGNRYVSWALQYLDGGFGFKQLLEAEEGVRTAISRELRMTARARRAGGHRHWRAVADMYMLGRLAVDPGFKKKGDPADRTTPRGGN